MKMKKILSGALAGALALSLSVPAFAATGPTPVKPVAETSESSFEVELEGMIYTPTIRVQVTQSGSVYVNPSKSAVAGTMTKALDGTIDLDYSFASQSVISTPILIRNDTDQALDVKATATATVPKTSEITLVDAASTATDTKEVYLAITGNGTALGTSDDIKASVASDGTKTINLTESNAVGTKKGLKAATDKKSAALTAAAKVAAVGAATQTKDATGKVTAVVPQYGVVVVSGTAAGKDAAWTENDVVNVTVALTFGISST